LAISTSVLAQDVGGSSSAPASRPGRVAAQRAAADLLGYALLDRVADLSRLLDRGVDVDAGDALGNTALIAAAASGSDGAVDLLLARGADVNRANSHHQSALMLAAWTGDARAVRSLLGRGADVRAADDLGRTALHYAADGFDPSIVGVLAQGRGDLDARDRRGRTALVYLASRSGPEVAPALGALIRAGADANATDDDGTSALMQAAEFGAAANVRALLAAHAATDLRDAAGRTALGYARQNGEAEIATLLERAGAAE
jgi:ankyrin repeat protein